ncbi:Flagellum site-determining protein YlxH [Alphaproteobacteria bacterium SO-S41]|nr:Flagellum site-determining protein YlxH [Alphaproteobacteria bacterium SO-S41]
MTVPLFAVASGKGGVGKTVLSIALAQSFAKRGERTLLFDGDIGLANIDVQLGLQPKGDLMEIVAGEMSMEDAVSPWGGGADVLGGFDVLAGQSGSGALRGLPERELALLGQSLKLVSAAYDRTVVDLGAGLDTAVLDLASLCDRALVVLTDEPTSLTDAYALIKVMMQRTRPPVVAVVVNMASDETEGRRVYGALTRATERFLGLKPPLAGIVRRDARVRDAIRAQTPYLTRCPSGATTQDIEKLAAAIDAVFAPRAAALALAQVK